MTEVSFVSMGVLEAHTLHQTRCPNYPFRGYKIPEKYSTLILNISKYLYISYTYDITRDFY
jgi:hypothetical protein